MVKRASKVVDVEDKQIIEEDVKNYIEVIEKPPAKRRGRKPKGGKIVQNATSGDDDVKSEPNIILHLKCSLKDLETDVTSNIESYNFLSNTKNELLYEVITKPLDEEPVSVEDKTSDTTDENKLDEQPKTNEILNKLKMLENDLYHNNINNKKSACFWCTCDFDNQPIYIPKFFIKDSYNVYGCFCTPECAAASLMNENIDSSVKFERYQLLNHIYSKIHDYSKNIKPAPNPYYMLDKFYGNLTIQEYRMLLRKDRLFLVVDKPLTRVLPELHEDNDDFIINNKVIPSNTYKIKRKSQKNKSDILQDKFGMSV
jgi:hypothetical protein